MFTTKGWARVTAEIIDGFAYCGRRAIATDVETPLVGKALAGCERRHSAHSIDGELYGESRLICSV